MFYYKLKKCDNRDSEQALISSCVSLTTNSVVSEYEIQILDTIVHDEICEFKSSDNIVLVRPAACSASENKLV